MRLVGESSEGYQRGRPLDILMPLRPLGSGIKPPLLQPLPQSSGIPPAPHAGLRCSEGGGRQAGAATLALTHCSLTVCHLGRAARHELAQHRPSEGCLQVRRDAEGHELPPWWGHLLSTG